MLRHSLLHEAGGTRLDDSLQRDASAKYSYRVESGEAARFRGGKPQPRGTVVTRVALYALLNVNPGATYLEVTQKQRLATFAVVSRISSI